MGEKENQRREDSGVRRKSVQFYMDNEEKARIRRGTHRPKGCRKILKMVDPLVGFTT